MSKDNLQAATKEIREWQSIEAGATFEIGRILTEVKESDIPRGEWTAWIESVGYNPRTAQRYMQIYSRFHTLPEAEGIPISKLAELLTIPVDVGDDVIKEYIRKASSKSVRELRKDVRKQFGNKDQSHKTTETTQKATSDEESTLKARIRVLERQVRELAHERDKYKRDAELAEERADRAEAVKWERLFNGNLGGLTPRQILGVQEGSTLKEVRKRYRELMQLLHPDKGGDAELFDIVKKAYDSIREGMQTEKSA